MVENKKKVKEALKNKQIDYATNSNWPFLGSFMKFLENSGVLKNLKKTTSTMEREILSPWVFVLIYIQKLICGISRISGSNVLLSDIPAMSLIGIKKEILVNGLCQRGDANQHGKGYKKNSLQS
ncbi:MAG: hypothetical protein PHY91_10150 [Tissierellia bacterium]|nr:hypothetical protein [Tissierellia bacterium]